MSQLDSVHIEITFHPRDDADLLPLARELQQKGQLAAVIKALMRLHIGKPATISLMEKLYAVERALLARLSNAPPEPAPPRQDDPLLDNL